MITFTSMTTPSANKSEVLEEASKKGQVSLLSLVHPSLRKKKLILNLLRPKVPKQKRSHILSALSTSSVVYLSLFPRVTSQENIPAWQRRETRKVVNLSRLYRLNWWGTAYMYMHHTWTADVLLGQQHCPLQKKGISEDACLG